MSDFLSAIGDVFGGMFGNDNSGSENQSAQNARFMKFIQDMRDRARADVSRLAPQYTQANAAGYQRMLDMIAPQVKEQSRLFSAGNVQAQRAIGTGMKQYSNAILGLPVNYNVLQQPSRLEPRTRFLEDMRLPPELRQKPNIARGRDRGDGGGDTGGTGGGGGGGGGRKNGRRP